MRPLTSRLRAWASPVANGELKAPFVTAQVDVGASPVAGGGLHPPFATAELIVDAPPFRLEACPTGFRCREGHVAPATCDSGAPSVGAWRGALITPVRSLER